MSRPLRTPTIQAANDGRQGRAILKRGRYPVDRPAVARRLGYRGRAQDGFTLIEVLVAALLVLIISAGVATALISSTDFTSQERNQSQADAVAQQDQERMKSMTDSQLTSLRQTRTVKLNNTQFTVVSAATFEDSTGASSCGSGTNAYFKLTSTVTSVATFGNPAQTVTEETVITRPLAGTLLVKVGNQTGAPLNGAAISISGQNTGYDASATTDTNGCVAFAGLPTDGYTITATDPGYVDPNGNATPSQAAAVTQTTIATPPAFVMGPAGSVRVAFMSRGTSVIYDGATGHGARPGADDLSYYGAGNGVNMSPNGCVVATGKCAGTGTPPVFNVSNPVGLQYIPGNLFPFYLGSSAQYTNNYQLWAGACEQEQPLTPPTGTGFASVTPGMAASPSLTAPDAIVDEPAIDVAIKYSGTVHPPGHVNITFTGKNATGSVTCTDTWHVVPALGPDTVSGTTYTAYPSPFASTAAKGSTSPMASNTGDPGTINVCADYNYSGTSYKHVTTTAGYTVTNFNGPTVIPTIDVTSGTAGQCT
jgi:prepilin-type N-terminal cleavage/methylation domain-containing protein